MEKNRLEGEVPGKNIILKETAAAEATIGPGQGWIR
jgi:hypothetical protein